MNSNLLRIYNYVHLSIANIKSSCYSLFIFGTPNYIYTGRNTKIYGYKTIQIGKNCHVMDNSSILGSVKIGNKVYIHENVLIRSNNYHIAIGDNTTINRNTNIQSQCKIGSNVLIAPNVVITGANHIFKDGSRTIKSQGSTSKGIVIEDDVWIAANSTILDGVSIGRGCVIAAGAVVNKDIPPYSVAVGVPAKVIKQR